MAPIRASVALRGRMSAPTAALLRVLLQREWRSPRLPVMLLVGVAIAVTAGWSASTLEASADSASAVLWYSTTNLSRSFGAYAAALFAVLGALACINRVADDHADGWLVPVLALAGRRAHYPALLYVSTVSVLLTAFVVLVISFSLAASLSGSSFAREGFRWIVGGGASIASASALGVALGLLLRSRVGAVLTGLTALVLPFLITMVHVLRTDSVPTAWLHRLLFLHLPPLSHSIAGSMLLQHAVYVASVLVLLQFVANRVVARYA